MARDKLRDKSYFEVCILNETRRIKKFEHAIEEVIKKRGNFDYGVKSTYDYLFGIYFNKLEALYSSGAPLEEIKDFIPDIIDIAEKIWNSNSKYVEIIWLISVGYMLNIDANEMKRLKKLIIRDGVEDYLIDFLLHSYDESWKVRTTSFKYDRPYKSLYNVIHAKDKNESIHLLKQYLEKEWYDGHDDMGWYDTHKREDELIYSGYWSFESGAIAKILELDDIILKDTPYYPYDMVHYTDNK